MKNISIYEPVSQEFLEQYVAKKGLKLEQYKNSVLPQEDYFLISEKYPIFVVADGVTLEFDKNGNYPNLSGAGELAKIFCETVIEKAEGIYSTFKYENLHELFEIGNKAAGAYNLSKGRVKDKLNYFDFDLFAATTSFALIKDGKMYWWSLCDAGVSVFDKDGDSLFRSPVCWPKENREKYLTLELKGKDVSDVERKKVIRRVYRNGVNDKGELIGYGVITGEEKALDYLKIGMVDLHDKDVVMVYTDGFENYLDLPEFIKIFNDWKNPDKDLKKLSEEKIKNDPDKYGHERSLFAIVM